MPSKFFIGIILFNISLSNCGSSGGSENLNNEKPGEICQAFVKAICTKDTVAFYKLVDKENLTTSMNDWINDEKKITQDDLFFPFFFVYSPLKIRHEDLMSRRKIVNFFTDFKIENEEVIDESNVKLSVTWTQNLPAAESQKIELRLKKSNEWKVVGASWKTL